MADKDLLLIGVITIGGLVAWKLGVFDSILGGIGAPSTTPTPPPAATSADTSMPAATPTMNPPVGFTPQVVTVPVPVALPAVPVTIIRTDKSSDSFAAAVEAQIRKECPSGSIKPSSTGCRNNIRHYYPEYAAAYGNADGQTQKQIVQSVAISTNCCCQPASMPCNYQAHVDGGLQRVLQF